MESFPTEAAVLNCIPGTFFLEMCRSFRATSEKLVLENYVLAYHKDHAKIFDLSFFLFYLCLKSWSYNTK